MRRKGSPIDSLVVAVRDAPRIYAGAAREASRHGAWPMLFDCSHKPASCFGPYMFEELHPREPIADRWPDSDTLVDLEDRVGRVVKHLRIEATIELLRIPTGGIGGWTDVAGPRSDNAPLASDHRRFLVEAMERFGALPIAFGYDSILLSVARPLPSVDADTIEWIERYCPGTLVGDDAEPQMPTRDVWFFHWP